MKLHKRYLGQITYAENATRTLELPRNYALVALDLMLIAKITRTSTAPDAGGPMDSAPAQLVKNLTVKANGSDTIKSIDMETLHRHNELMYGVRPFIYSHELLGYADAADKTVKVFARVPFAMPRAIKQVDTLLDTAALSSLDLIVTFGAGRDIMNDAWPGTGTAPVVTVTEATLHVTAVEYVGVPAGSNFMIYNQWNKQQQVTAVTNRYQIKLPVGNVYRGLLLKTHSGGMPQDTILPFGLANLNELQLRSGTEVFVQEIAGILQAQNRLDHEMQVPERIGSGAALNHAMQELLLEGYYYIDFCRDGRLSEALDTRALSDLELILQVANPGGQDFDDFVEVYADELILPAVATA